MIEEYRSSIAPGWGWAENGAETGDAVLVPAVALDLVYDDSGLIVGGPRTKPVAVELAEHDLPMGFGFDPGTATPGPCTATAFAP